LTSNSSKATHIAGSNDFDCAYILCIICWGSFIGYKQRDNNLHPLEQSLWVLRAQLKHSPTWCQTLTEVVDAISSEHGILTRFGVYLVSISIEQEVDFSGMKRNNRKRYSPLNAVLPTI
jgi:hypothetical protein